MAVEVAPGTKPDDRCPAGDYKCWGCGRVIRVEAGEFRGDRCARAAGFLRDVIYPECPVCGRLRAYDRVAP